MGVLVLGAGIIGTSTAWHLLERGHDVTVIERQDAAARETALRDVVRATGIDLRDSAARARALRQHDRRCARPRRPTSPTSAACA